MLFRSFRRYNSSLWCNSRYFRKSTKILDRETGKISYGEVPPYSVVVPGALQTERPEVSLACAVIVKKVDEKTRSKTSINELLRS